MLDRNPAEQHDVAHTKYLFDPPKATFFLQDIDSPVAMALVHDDQKQPLFTTFQLVSSANIDVTVAPGGFPLPQKKSLIILGQQ